MLLPLALGWGLSGTAAGALTLRVAIGSPSRTKSITVTHPAKLVTRIGKIHELAPGRWFTLDTTHAGTVELSKDAYILVGERWYPGVVEFHPVGDKLLAINLVELETYL
ncbi:hypothetical protein [Gloeobacter violaceus]|nr:hypothetical protein [Gloeobacter violaceus]